jgi:hypothetical protein
MPARRITIHLSELLAKVRRYDADQEDVLKAKAEKRVPELLRASGRLTKAQGALLSEALAAGLSLNEIRHDRTYLIDVPESKEELLKANGDKMLRALGGSIRDVPAQACRKWGRKKWADLFGCEASDVPDPAAVVKAFDRMALGNLMAVFRQKAIAQIRSEQVEELGDGELGDEFFKSPIWEYTAQQVIRRATFTLSTDELGECVGRIALNVLDESTPASRLMERLDRAGFTDQLLRNLWAKYRTEAKAMRLPHAPGVAKDEIQDVSKPKAAKQGRPPKYNWRVDRKIAKAWKTGQYSSKEQLGVAFGMTRPDVIAALDRDRKLPGSQQAKRGTRKKS